MANRTNQKLKLLYVLKILIEKTDDEHGLTTQEFLEELAFYGIEAERKGLYHDFATLNEFGLTVDRKSNKFWYLVTRPLELQEMILLIDAVQSTPSLTEELTEGLIERIKAFASVNQHEELERRIENLGRVKMANKAIFENIDIIQQAIRKKCKVAFKYFHYDVNKDQVLKREGKTYTLTPVRLVYADELYYFIAFDDDNADQHKHNPFTPFRVDRMIDVEISIEPGTRNSKIANFRTYEYIIPSFGVYAVEIATVTLEFDQSVMNQIIDKFGIDAVVFEKEGGRAHARVKAPLSPQFYGWLMQLGSCVKIIHPKRAIEEFTSLIQRTKNLYTGKYRICSGTASEAISQDQFLELIDYLKEKLKQYIDGNLGGIGFATEYAFDTFIWDAINDWLHGRNIDDGMPCGPLRELAFRDVTRLSSGSINDKKYLSYGQIVGEAIAILNPRNFASEEYAGTFFDTSVYTDPMKGVGFSFYLLPNSNRWEIDGPARRYYIGKDAYYEIRRERINDDKNKPWIYKAFFVAPEIGVQEEALEPWIDIADSTSAFKAVSKHWQMIAYRFS